jgi:hypothetical protein
MARGTILAHFIPHESVRVKESSFGFPQPVHLRRSCGTLESYEQIGFFTMNRFETAGVDPLTTSRPKSRAMEVQKKPCRVGTRFTNNLRRLYREVFR